VSITANVGPRGLIVLVSEIITNVKHEKTQREKYSGNSVKDVNFTIGPECKAETWNALYYGCSGWIGRVRAVLNSWTRNALNKCNKKKYCMRMNNLRNVAQT